jgi:hypothetical protein
MNADTIIICRISCHSVRVSEIRSPAALRNLKTAFSPSLILTVRLSKMARPEVLLNFTQEEPFFEYRRDTGIPKIFCGFPHFPQFPKC